jgi:hypothetical protein
MNVDRCSPCVNCTPNRVRGPSVICLLMQGRICEWWCEVQIRYGKGYDKGRKVNKKKNDEFCQLTRQQCQ